MFFVSGWLCDITGKYDLSFYLAGMFIAISGLMLVILPLIKRYKRFMVERQASSDAPVKDVSLQVAKESNLKIVSSENNIITYSAAY